MWKLAVFRCGSWLFFDMALGYAASALCFISRSAKSTALEVWIIKGVSQSPAAVFIKIVLGERKNSTQFRQFRPLK
jgi:hypothetical protein